MLIALTGYGSDEDVRRSMQAGIDKPSDEAGRSVEAARAIDLDEPSERSSVERRDDFTSAIQRNAAYGATRLRVAANDRR